MSPSGIYKLVAPSRRRPSVYTGAPEPEYWRTHFNGTPLPVDWQPPPHKVRGASHSLADALSWKESIPLLSERAVSLFRQVAPDCAEYRPFARISGQDYYALNVLAAVDILDEANSETTRSASGEIITITRYAFIEAAPNPPPVFKLRSHLNSDVLCTEALAEAVVAARLTGFCFRNPHEPSLKSLWLGQDTNAYPGVKS